MKADPATKTLFRPITSFILPRTGPRVMRTTENVRLSYTTVARSVLNIFVSMGNERFTNVKSIAPIIVDRATVANAFHL